MFTSLARSWPLSPNSSPSFVYKFFRLMARSSTDTGARSASSASGSSTSQSSTPLPRGGRKISYVQPIVSTTSFKVWAACCIPVLVRMSPSKIATTFWPGVTCLRMLSSSLNVPPPGTRSTAMWAPPIPKAGREGHFLTNAAAFFSPSMMYRTGAEENDLMSWCGDHQTSLMRGGCVYLSTALSYLTRYIRGSWYGITYAGVVCMACRPIGYAPMSSGTSPLRARSASINSTDLISSSRIGLARASCAEWGAIPWLEEAISLLVRRHFVQPPEVNTPRWPPGCTRSRRQEEPLAALHRQTTYYITSGAPK